MRKKLEASRDNAFLSYDLGTIRRDAPIDTTLAHYQKGAGDPQKAAAAMVKLELFSLLEKFGLDGIPAPQGGSSLQQLDYGGHAASAGG